MSARVYPLPPTIPDMQKIRQAIHKLREARTLLHKAGAHRAANYAARALKSAEGAERTNLKNLSAVIASDVIRVPQL